MVHSYPISFTKAHFYPEPYYFWPEMTGQLDHDTCVFARFGPCVPEPLYGTDFGRRTGSRVGSLRTAQRNLDALMANDGPKYLPNLIPDIASWVQEVEDATPTPWLVSDLVPASGLVLLSGKQKVSGKTYFALALGLSIAYGKGTHFGGFVVDREPGRVLYVLEEGGKSETARRYSAIAQAAGMPIPPNQQLAFRPGLKLDIPDHQRKLIRTVEEHQSDLVVLDPFFRMTSGDENNQETVNRALDPIYKLIGKLNCTVLLLVHTKKKQVGRGARSEDMDDAIRGSSILANAYDGHIAIRNNKRTEGLPIPVETRFKDAPWQKASLIWQLTWAEKHRTKIPIVAKPELKWKS